MSVTTFLGIYTAKYPLTVIPLSPKAWWTADHIFLSQIPPPKRRGPGDVSGTVSHFPTQTHLCCGTIGPTVLSAGISSLDPTQESILQYRGSGERIRFKDDPESLRLSIKML